MFRGKNETKTTIFKKVQQFGQLWRPTSEKWGGGGGRTWGPHFRTWGPHFRTWGNHHFRTWGNHHFRTFHVKIHGQGVLVKGKASAHGPHGPAPGPAPAAPP